jgi:hypothetical protein
MSKAWFIAGASSGILGLARFAAHLRPQPEW